MRELASLHILLFHFTFAIRSADGYCTNSRRAWPTRNLRHFFRRRLQLINLCCPSIFKNKNERKEKRVDNIPVRNRLPDRRQSVAAEMLEGAACIRSRKCLGANWVPMTGRMTKTNYWNHCLDRIHPAATAARINAEASAVAA